MFKNMESTSLEPFRWRMCVTEDVMWTPFPLGVFPLTIVLIFVRGCCYGTDLSEDLLICITLH